MTITEILRRLAFRARGRVVYLSHTSDVYKGGVLLSYVTHPFLAEGGKELTTHTNYWEVHTLAEEFLKRGYDVDVIDADNMLFVPKKKYTYLLDIHANLERLAPLLPPDCIKILFTTTSYWKFNNNAEEKRLEEVAKRRGVAFPPERMLTPTQSLEYADHVLYFGNALTLGTFPISGDKARNIPISTTFTYDAPHKEWSVARNGFVWVGGAGVIHKGVDLLVEAFSATPALSLHLCGKYESPHFAAVYAAELAKPNISQHGTVDLGGTYFKQMRGENAFVISPSCAEGQSGAVILGMHAGLIPIVSKECGVDVEDFGFVLPDCSTETIARTIQHCSQFPETELRLRAEKAWAYAQKHHTRTIFANTFASFIESLEKRIV